jgi:hypothetical protein
VGVHQVIESLHVGRTCNLNFNSLILLEKAMRLSREALVVLFL